MPEDIGETEENKNQAKELLVSVHLNLALVYLKVAPVHYYEAKDHATQALKFDASNIKGLFRRGQALLGLGEPELALQDFQQVLETEPHNKVTTPTDLTCSTTNMAEGFYDIVPLSWDCS